MPHFQTNEISNKPEELDLKSKIKLFSNKIKSLSEQQTQQRDAASVEEPTQPFLQRRNSTGRTGTATRNTLPETNFTRTGSLRYPHRKPKLAPLAKHVSLAQKNEDQTKSNEQLIRENSILKNLSFLSNARRKVDANNDKHYSPNKQNRNYDGKATNEKGK